VSARASEEVCGGRDNYRLDNDYFVMIKEGIGARCKELGIGANVQEARGRDDVQIKQLETLMKYAVLGLDSIPQARAALKDQTAPSAVP